jgi:hypothetical protein
MVCPSFWEDYYMLICTQSWELMNSVGSHGSSSLPFVMKVMVCHFVSDSHEVMTALIVVLPSIVVVEISLQLHRSVIGETEDMYVVKAGFGAQGCWNIVCIMGEKHKKIFFSKHTGS